MGVLEEFLIFIIKNNLIAFFERMTNGWTVAKMSLKVLNAHKSLLVFPILSGISIAFVIASFMGVLLNAFGWRFVGTDNVSNGAAYLGLFVFYIVTYFIVVFFNMSLMYCAKIYFDGGQTSVSQGLRFSAGRIHYIFLWTVFAATVGAVLRMLQDKLGWLGKILVGFIGIAWSIATFFVIPVLAYENVSPMEALKRSTNIMKEKWGEGITANFSIGLIGFGVMIVIAIVSMAISALVNEQAGIILLCLGFLFVVTVGSALHSILISALYNQLTGNPNEHMNDGVMGALFVEK